jgi:phosphatidylserine/phosphatidylglycerophosphate/cardiolipin synthase-like enzyme
MQIIQDKEIHTEVVENGILKARQFVWIATANLKDMHIRQGSKYISILDRFVSLSSKGVAIRVIHASEPSGPFKESFDKHKELIRGDIEFLLCPRIHFKMVIVDHKIAYTGSANFTGAGMGVKSKNRRNFEIGIVFDEKDRIRQLEKIFDEIWMGEKCPACERRNVCPEPIE